MTGEELLELVRQYGAAVLKAHGSFLEDLDADDDIEDLEKQAEAVFDRIAEGVEELESKGSWTS
jgi:hypothetical protein